MTAREMELEQLIKRALMLADELNLGHVGIRLDGARLALKDELDTTQPQLRSDDLVGSLPTLPSFRPRAGSNVVKLHEPASLEKLLAEHEALEAKRTSLLALAAGPCNPAEAEEQLASFGALIQVHRATERRCVYGPLMSDEVKTEPGLEVWLEGLVGQMETDWQSYLEHWDRDKIGDRWAEFASTTYRILTRAGERMRLEEKVVYPLAFSSGLILLRDPAP